MKILGINGSPRGQESMTGRLVDAVLRGAREAGAEIEFIDAAALRIRPCSACTLCYQTGECPKQDDFAALYEKMLEADGIVFGSPNYIDNVSAQMKVVFDRMADAVHCQFFAGKYGCAVATAGGAGADDIATYLNHVLQVLGADTVGAAAAVMVAGPEAFAATEKEAFALGKNLAAAITDCRTYPEQEALHAEMAAGMKALVFANKDVWKHQYDHWVAQDRN
ncbi:flavodoxin family protein [Methanofollis sp. UBA420]|jgi:multimeric flavodoxin WrbA|uniref:flavodoxin family protein n=1 Tax=Methanofollis sp. UBA420 TaxID=1915514 RepID=UPI00316AD8C0